MRIVILIVVLAGIVFVFGRYYSGSKSESMTDNSVVILVTNKGDIEVELFEDKAPRTVKNFITLAEKNFYNDTLFHRVIPNFMIQGGDPNTRAGDPITFGTGGPGYSITDEFGGGLSNVLGTLSMAGSGPNTGGSQFFINVADNTYLDGRHAVFGKVIKGMDVVLAISKVPTTGEPLNRPHDPVRIDRVIIKK